MDGTEVEFTVVWDTAISAAIPLSIGDAPELIDPVTGSSTNFIVTANPVNLNRKQEGEFSITAKYFTTAGVPGQ